MAIIEVFMEAFSLVLICCTISAQILPTSNNDQGSFALSEFAPTEFCYRFKSPELSFGYCLSACLVHSGNTYTVSLNQGTAECACCDYPLAEKKAGSEDWMSFVRCPNGFTEVRYDGSKYCFKLVWSPELYSTAREICENLINHNPSEVELVKLNSLEKLYAFETFLKHLKAPGDIWIQGMKHLHKWKYHDGTLMDQYCPLDLSNGLGEHYMRFRTYAFQCADYDSSPLSYVCEAYI